MKPFTILVTEIATLALVAGAAFAAPLAIKNSGSFEPNLTIDAPDGATFEEKFTNTVVTKGKNFQIMISAGKEDLPAAKKAYNSPEGLMKDVKKYDVDDKDTLLFEGTMFGVRGYHFVHNVKVGKSFFKCTDWRKPDGVYTKADVETMLTACKTLQKGKKK
jgi:hypothetical protein